MPFRCGTASTRRRTRADAASFPSRTTRSARRRTAATVIGGITRRRRVGPGARRPRDDRQGGCGSAEGPSDPRGVERFGSRGGRRERPGRQRRWWSRAGSNRRPLQCDCSALPAELRPHSGGCIEFRHGGVKAHACRSGTAADRGARPADQATSRPRPVRVRPARPLRLPGDPMVGVPAARIGRSSSSAVARARPWAARHRALAPSRPPPTLLRRPAVARGLPAAARHG